ncbi:glycosyltransferase [Proteiniborus sp. MB09-C3]|uniref:glycosyltransferase n=1 Tax=Proteiniborus sp. MB09-C3 TaxID=3050072 RepID=UPI0025543CD8|nr:glycosyltransferase [Proteiniborus sp. MB09-C3]WIV12114.1 glycosyltransferase [Proteiniborus sp. MB09-C3]
MRIMVFDVPAENGGALTILKQYYEKAINDRGNEWIFVISTPELKGTDNVKILRYPWVKKSWIHRLYFDKMVAKRLAKTSDIDEIISLQNVVIKDVKVKQTLYLHQPLPFIEKKYGLVENYKFWIYQNIISRMIYNSVKKADKVIIQTNWLKEACLKKVNTDPNKFELVQPEMNIKVENFYKQDKDNFRLFFFPSSALIYKNHRVIVEAAHKMTREGILNFRIIFTLKGDENKNIRDLYRDIKKHDIPIDFIGYISIEEVYEYYSKSVLIFPSYIETFGLPLLEAKMHNSPILASDCAFSHEILDDYDKVRFFNPFNSDQLYSLMKDYII